jgi:hypothetical protein
MERRVTSHTEEEEMNQRRRLLTLARKGDQKAVESLFELYQVRVFSGEALKKKKLPSFPLPNSTGTAGRGMGKSGKKLVKIPKLSSSEAAPKAVSAMATQEAKKKSMSSSGLTGQTKGSKSSPDHSKHGRALSAKKVTTKPGRVKKSASISKTQKKKPTLSARPSRVKKK